MIEKEYVQPYRAMVIKEGNNIEVGIVDKENKIIGTYNRNYHTLHKTFYPFEQDGQWYALYSKDYTATRIMSLPNCKDICGEYPSSIGFCPVEYFVPKFFTHEAKDNDPCPILANHNVKKWAKIIKKNKYTYYCWPDDPDCQGYIHLKEEYIKEREESHKAYEEWLERNPLVEKFAPFGFVAGCIWGDDSSWKIQFLDLSKIKEGKAIRDDRFGYIELPQDLSLENAIGEIFDLNNDKSNPVSEHIFQFKVACNICFRMWPDGTIHAYGKDYIAKNTRNDNGNIIDTK